MAHSASACGSRKQSRITFHKSESLPFFHPSLGLRTVPCPCKKIAECLRWVRQLLLCAGGRGGVRRAILLLLCGAGVAVSGGLLRGARACRARTCRRVAQDHRHRLPIQRTDQLFEPIEVEAVLYEGGVHLAEELVVPQHAKPGHPGGLVERAAFLGGGERALRRLHQTGRGLPGDLGALWVASVWPRRKEEMELRAPVWWGVPSSHPSFGFYVFFLSFFPDPSPASVFLFLSAP